MMPNRIEEKINLARDLRAQWGDDLMADASISAKLRELAGKIRASAAATMDAGVSNLCRQCDEEEGGSCCGAGIEDHYTPELLLINLLLGVELPGTKQSEKSCHFLGDRGCVLSARDIICINYICANLRKAIALDKLIALQEVNGAEMELLFLLHDRIKRFIRQKTAESGGNSH